MGFGGWGDAGREVVKAGVSSDHQGRASEHTSPWASTTNTTVLEDSRANCKKLGALAFLLGVADVKCQVNALPHHVGVRIKDI